MEMIGDLEEEKYLFAFGFAHIHSMSKICMAVSLTSVCFFPWL